MAGRLEQCQRPCRVLVCVRLSLSRQRDRSGESVQRRQMALAAPYINRLDASSQAQSGPRTCLPRFPQAPLILVGQHPVHTWVRRRRSLPTCQRWARVSRLRWARVSRLRWARVSRLRWARVSRLRWARVSHDPALDATGGLPGSDGALPLQDTPRTTPCGLRGRGALRLRAGTRRHKGRDGRRSRPTVSASAGCALDLSGSRADHSVAEHSPRRGEFAVAMPLPGFIRTLARVKEKSTGVRLHDHDLEGDPSDVV
jgi:hypothetical protein